MKEYRTGIKWLRAAIQTFFLAWFVYLALAVTFGWSSPVARDLFLRFDPLVWIAGSMASREIAPYALLALALVLTTLLFGRVFCGWICPLGTVIDAGRVMARRKRRRADPPGGRRLRYWILAALLGLALAGVNLSGWLDPLVLSSRAVHAAARFGVFGPSAWIAWGLVAVAVLLTLLAARYWCRSLCPLGTLLSLAARTPWLGRWVSQTCNDCGVCATVCPMDRAPGDSSVGDCLVCRRCEAVCPRQSILFGLSYGGSSLPVANLPEASTGAVPADPQRRRLLAGLVTGIGGISIGMAAGTGFRAGRDPVPLRPPGAQVEPKLAARCVGCGACMAVCPTGGLLPLVALGRLDALFTPRLVPRVGPCLPECTACGDVCPTGAIPKLRSAEKLRQTIGTAEIDQQRCLPWATGDRCVICVDACPEEFQAVKFHMIGPRVFRPVVDPARCTGCGICEHRCPVEGAAAIRVQNRTGIRGVYG
jgi:MauM/NapG family ferredoxin protein